jgi:membrane protein
MKTIATLFLDIFKGYERKHLQLIAAGLAFYFVMSLFPALVLVTGLAAYLPIQNATQRAISFMSHVIPQQNLYLVEPIATSISAHRSGLLWLGIITTLWLTSIGANAIIQGLDIVYEVPAPRSLWLNRFIAVLLTLVIGLLLLLAVVLTVVGPMAERLLASTNQVQHVWIRLWPYLQWLLAGAFTFTAIELLYVFAPNTPLTKRITIPGAVVAATAWLILSWGLGFFFHELTKSKLDTIYGVFATPIAVLTWLKWGATAILIGAETNIRLHSRQLFANRAVPNQASRFRVT